MTISDLKINPDSHLLHRPYVVEILTVADTQTAKVVWSYAPGFTFQVLGVRFFCTAVANITNVDVLIGSTSVLTAAMTPSANTEVTGTLSSTLATKRGSATAAIKVAYTSTGSASLANGAVTIILRPYPVGNQQ